ncbi:GNAT family N-acetyltransferase [Levilactobacillus fujinensis]|uniref:GNAT family N-acetyltransferase n=1 Tax=Levilactobacillus fujinensis TaxID=2486024 RepID=A0ABW1TIL3_9LACO|nr:GNAT family N-acetyltransferase [Levilactobacillus fujinensis]
MIEWRVRTFNSLTPAEFYDVAFERIRTFVIAQQRIYQEIDKTDKVAKHILGYQDGRLVAYARVFTEQEHVTFGRVLTIPELRGQGLGRQLVAQIEAEIHTEFAGLPISIEAQIDKQQFYEKFGYEAAGDVFLFNSTPHIQMNKAAL